ncbi:TPA: alpha/beta hydrolase [Pseudomonas aeruginosa]|nr:alpha/beta hydrolase [Pseudomonas aeruginosa]
MDQFSQSRRSLLQGAALVGVALSIPGHTLAQTPTATPSDLNSAAPTRFQDIGDVRLAYRRFGKTGATPVVCLQHFTGTMNNWDPTHTNRLAQDREVVLVDYRGVGRSEGQTPDSVQALAADIIAFIHALGLPQVDVFGFSLGGFVAQQIALDAPTLVRRLILTGTGPSGGEGMAEFSPQVKEIIARPNTSPEERRLALFFSPSEQSQSAGRAWQARISTRQEDREPESTPQVAQAQLTAITRWGAIVGERYSSLARITQPTLVVNGHNDIMVPTVNSYILQQRLPNARLILYPDSSHGAHFQYPQEFADSAARFLATP